MDQGIFQNKKINYVTLDGKYWQRDMLKIWILYRNKIETIKL
jgi:hypothetical protein